MLTTNQVDKLVDVSLRLFEKGTEFANDRGLILVDTKYEFGKTKDGKKSIGPVFILDQTFCPNIQFLAEGEILSTGKAISYASGSKFPSGGKCTAGYCVGNFNSESLMEKIAIHLSLCDNEATDFQYQMLAEQMPSMNQRITNAYKNTRDFVSFIEENIYRC